MYAHNVNTTRGKKQFKISDLSGIRQIQAHIRLDPEASRKAAKRLVGSLRGSPPTSPLFIQGDALSRVRIRTLDPACGIRRHPNLAPFTVQAALLGIHSSTAHMRHPPGVRTQSHERETEH